MDGMFGNQTIQNFLYNVNENNNSILFKQSVKYYNVYL